MKQLNIIYLCADSANNFAIPDSKVWDINLRQSLIKMGHNVIVPDLSVSELYQNTYDHIPDREKNRLEFSEKVLTEIKKIKDKQKVDLVFSYFYTKHILPETVVEIKRLGLLTVNFYCNAVHQFDLVSEIAPLFDYCMVPEKEAVPKYISVNANPIHIQMAANSEFYKPYTLTREFDATFVGQQYLNRAEYVNYLFKHGIEVRVWGPGWKQDDSMKNRLKNIVKTVLDKHYPLPPNKVGNILSDHELVKIYSRSKINLGFSEVLVEGNLKRHIRLRDFEAPMSGAFYLTGYQEELNLYYDIGKEIVCYDTKEELLEKVKYYLVHEEEAQKIREAGYNRALNDHKWENRFLDFFTHIGLL